MGHTKQIPLWKTETKHSMEHGGELRKMRSGRGVRPLSTKEPLHLVFKMNREFVPFGFRHPKAFSWVNRTIEKYARRFLVKVDQLSIQGDHIHLLVRTHRRSQYHHFFRVVAGQISQGLVRSRSKNVTDTPKRICSPGKTESEVELAKEERRGGRQKKRKAKPRFWLHRPFTRVVRGWRAYKTVRDYILLNEAEVTGHIRYQKDRLRGLTESERRSLSLTAAASHSRPPPLT